MLIQSSLPVQSILPHAIKQGDVQLWLTAFDEIAVDILGTPASKFDSLDESGRIKLVGSD